MAGIDIESEDGMKVIVTIGKNKLKLDGLRCGVTLRTGFGKYVYYIQDSSEDRFSVDLKETAANGIKGIGDCGVIHTVDRIKDAIHTAEI